DLERGRLVDGPGHPSLQVLKVLVDGAFESRRVGDRPRPKHQALRLDSRWELMRHAPMAGCAYNVRFCCGHSIKCGRAAAATIAWPSAASIVSQPRRPPRSPHGA